MHTFQIPLLDGSPWETIPSIALLDTVTGRPPSQATHVRLARSSQALHIHFAVEDTYAWATLTERDGPLWTEEVVEVFLDPVGDGEGYYEWELNPLGTVLDLVLRRSRSGYRKDFRWQCADLETRAETTSTGWVAEFVIPFHSIVSAPPQPGEEWRANFCRIDRPRDGARELSAWSPTGMPLFHVPSRFGRVRF